MKLKSLDASTYRRMPWANGLGTTDEIARAPESGDFDWRVSVAQVATDGPFSTFPGCERIILALEGGGMTLTHHETATEVVVGLLEPWAFSGDVTTTSVLHDGPISDFNVITRRAAFTSRVHVVRLTLPTMFEITAAVTLIYSAEGTVHVEGDSATDLLRGHSLLIEHEGDVAAQLALRPAAEGATLVITELFAV
jgi:environmental stress-induced protein Ves